MDKRIFDVQRRDALVAVCTAALMLGGCSAKTPNNLAAVPLGTSSSGNQVQETVDPLLSANTAAAQMGERYDAAAEEEISKESLAAWRVAVAHPKQTQGQSTDDWKQQRQTDEKNAMSQLQDLASRHSNSSTVFFMMGQVEELFGKNAQAAEYFSKSRVKNTINPVSLFKLAENERLSGKLTEATAHFQQLYKAAPEFYPGRLGLAQCLLKQNPQVAAQLAQGVVDNVKDDTESVQKAQEILSELKGSKPSR
jgi:predicted Zn-dependent protease